jgi:hypothetical protein
MHLHHAKRSVRSGQRLKPEARSLRSELCNELLQSGFSECGHVERSGQEGGRAAVWSERLMFSLSRARCSQTRTKSQMPHRYETPWTFSRCGITHSIYSIGVGPDVVVLHELPGLIQECLDLGVILSERVPARVHMPLLFGNPQPRFFGRAANAVGICVSREIHAFAANKRSPIVCWCRALCRKLNAESNSSGVGVVGMCLTGGFALSLVADDAILAAVVAQPSLPLFIHRAALGISDEDAKAVTARADRQDCVLGLRFRRDFISPRARMNAVGQLVGPNFDCLELPGCKHSTLTVDRHPRALEKTISFLSKRLGAQSPNPAPSDD